MALEVAVARIKKLEEGDLNFFCSRSSEVALTLTLYSLLCKSESPEQLRKYISEVMMSLGAIIEEV